MVKKSEKPHILVIGKIKNDKNMLDNPEKLLAATKEFSPLSGSELEYNPKLWNENDHVRTTHNCYSYAMGKIRKGLDSKAQPGYASGFNHISNSDYDCKHFYRRMKKDVPGSYLESFDKPCLKGFYKIFFVLDPKNDYHWYRMDSDGYWSHKPGSTNATNLDASGEKIKNPNLANRKYNSLNYYKPCFFACVYSDLSRSLSNIYNLD